MSTASNLHHAGGDYFTLAQKFVTETEDLLKPGRTIAQSPDAFEALRATAKSLQMCGGHGWLFIFDDHSAVMTSNEADYIWPHWVT
jgi:hypothetical protein